MKLLIENWRKYLAEASVLPSVIKKIFRDSIVDSKFWELPHYEKDIELLGMQSDVKNLLGTPATRELMNTLNNAAEKLGTELDFVITVTGDNQYALEPTDSNGSYPNNWLMHGQYSGPLNKKHIIWVEFRPLGPGYQMRDLDHQELVNILARTINHELVHYQQLKKQAISKNISDEEAWDELLKDPHQVPTTNNREEYLSRHNEIDAFAHEAAEELLNKHTREEALQLIKTRHDNLGGVVRDYINVFGNNPVELNKFWTKLYTQIVQQSKSSSRD